MAEWLAYRTFGLWIQASRFESQAREKFSNQNLELLSKKTFCTERAFIQPNRRYFEHQKFSLDD